MTFLFLTINILIVGPKCFSKNIVVTTGNDSIAGSLRDAVNIAVNGDEITFDQSLAEIKLGEQININKSITISGNPNLQIHDKYGAIGHRIFEINGLEPIVVNFNNLMLSKIHERIIDTVRFDTNGKIILIRNTNSVVNINSCYFVKDNSGYGGFLHYYTQNFYGQHGGGIAQYGGTLNISNTTFSELEASGEIYSGNGGAICQLSGELNLVNSTFYQNSAGVCNNSKTLGLGSAIYSQDSKVSVTNCTFCEQLTYYSYTKLGPPLTTYTSKTHAISLSNASLTIKNSIFYNNGGRDIGGNSSTFYTGGYNIFESTNSTGTGDLKNLNPGFVLNKGHVELSNSTNWIPVCVLDAAGPAIDAIPSTGNGAPEFDQRGHARINNPDIGAVEFEGCIPGVLKSKWNESDFKQSDWAYNMSLVDQNTIWIIDSNVDSVSLTTDGGHNWDVLPCPILKGSTPAVAGGIFAMSDKKAYCIVSTSDSKGIYLTTDGGNNWSKQSTAFNQESPFPDFIYFWDENEGVAVGDAFPDSNFEIYTTSNGGNLWSRVSESNIPESKNEYSWNNHEAFRIVGNSIFFLTNTARLFKSENKGATWKVINTPFHNASDSILTFDFKDQENGLIAFCSPDGANKKIYRTTDGGKTWKNLTSTNYFQRIKYIPLANAYVSTNINGGLSYSCDDGQTWTSVSYFDNTKLRIAEDGHSGKLFLGGMGKLFNSSDFFSIFPEDITVESQASNNKSFEINSNTGWTVSCDQSWLTFDKISGIGNSSIKLSVSENNSANYRNATIRILSESGDSKTIIVTQKSKSTGITHESLSDIKIYPNPAQSMLSIEGGKPNGQISIYDTSGRLLLKATNQNNQVDISSLNSGLYIIRIESPTEIANRKFIKK